MEDRCISCGAVIPEGKQICPQCEQGGMSIDEIIENLSLEKLEIAGPATRMCDFLEALELARNVLAGMKNKQF